jgi:hypothetical protein
MMALLSLNRYHYLHPSKITLPASIGKSLKFTRDFALTPFHLETSGQEREESSAAEALPSAPCYNGSSNRMLEQGDDKR